MPERRSDACWNAPRGVELLATCRRGGNTRASNGDAEAYKPGVWLLARQSILQPVRDLALSNLSYAANLAIFEFRLLQGCGKFYHSTDVWSPQHWASLSHGSCCRCCCATRCWTRCPGSMRITGLRPECRGSSTPTRSATASTPASGHHAGRCITSNGWPHWA
jgi:hypothetical protein